MCWCWRGMDGSVEGSVPGPFLLRQEVEPPAVMKAWRGGPGSILVLSWGPSVPAAPTEAQRAVLNVSGRSSDGQSQ